MRRCRRCRRCRRAVAVPPAAVAVLLLLAAPPAPAVAAEGVSACSNPQSPRDAVAPFDAQSGRSIIEVVAPDRVVYTPRKGGEPQELHRCGQHYHFPIENHQRCAGETSGGADESRHEETGEGRSGHAMWSDEAGHARQPKPGDVVEVHTVYAAKTDPRHCPAAGGECCDPESLACCLAPPFVVRAFNATVTAGGAPGPIEPPPGRPLSEWSGSTTGPDDEPGQCKPAAQWSFRLGCGFEVSEGQLSAFHPHEARVLQTGDRVSDDLTLVTP